MNQAVLAPCRPPDRFAELKHMIGNTPLLGVSFLYRGKPRTVYAKAEHLNMTGSIKDRMAFHILRSAYREGRVRPGDVIAEATSGNTGISFAAIGRKTLAPDARWDFACERRFLSARRAPDAF